MNRALLLLLVLLLPACASNRFGPGVLNLHNQRSGETAVVEYRAPDGRVVMSGLQQASHLMRDVRTEEAHAMDIGLLDQLVTIRNAMRLPASTLIEITSGYRSPATNAMLRTQSQRVASNSYHLYGQAIDFKIPGVSSQAVYETARRLNMGGTAIYQNSQHVHIDTGPPRTWATN